MKFGSSLANGTVWLAGGAVETVVPLAVAGAVGEEVPDDVKLVLTLESTEEELPAVGAAVAIDERRMAQNTEESSLFILGMCSLAADSLSPSTAILY